MTGTLSWGGWGGKRSFLSYWLHCCRGSGRCDLGLQMPLQDCYACKAPLRAAEGLSCHMHPAAESLGLRQLPLLLISCGQVFGCGWKVQVSCTAYPDAASFSGASRSLAARPSVWDHKHHLYCSSGSTSVSPNPPTLMCRCVEFSRALACYRGIFVEL